MSAGGAPGERVEFRVLGDIEVRADGQPIDAGHARQRAVLAVLIFELGRVVPADRLIDRVWGDRPPRSVRNVLYGYVARLRAAIAETGDPDVVLNRRPGGYLLEADRDQVDLYRFRHLVSEAGAAGDDERAGPLLASALGLWRGPALAGLDSPWLSGIRDTLEMERLAAVLDLGDIALRQGRTSPLVRDLAEEAVTYPTDERLIGQLMLALYRLGRTAEALRWFEQTRQHLAAEFGADPGPRLRALHQQILRADPGLAAPEPASGPGRPGTEPTEPAGPVPRELPADVLAFTGRESELAELDRLVAGGAAAVISAVSGTAGVGKTALAVHWAHRAVGRFPDGQLYANLRGYDPGQPLTAADALAGFLRGLGVAGRDIPAGTDERAARYRSLLAGRHLLIVADNVGSVDQVRPLLPGTPGCALLVTSRDSLAGLVARDGAVRLDLDLLPADDAARLLRTLIGERAHAEPGAIAELAVQCSRLPLALRVAAEMAVARAAAQLTDLAGELAGQQSRLDLLDADGDPRTAVRAVFSWSYQHLDPASARAFRLLGLHPGADAECYCAAALTGGTTGQASQALELLAAAHLIHPAGPGRYGMHDLLRGYACELASVDGEEARQALTRLFDHYLHTAAGAMDTLFPAEASRRPHVPPSASPRPSVSEPDVARSWLDAQLPALVAVTAHAAGHGWPGYASRLATTLWRYLEVGGHYPEAIAINGSACRDAEQTGDRSAEAEALNSLGVVHWRLGRYPQATGYMNRALALFRQTGNRAGQARALANLGNVERLAGHAQKSIDLHEQALAVFRQIGDRPAEGRELSNLGAAIALRGNYPGAADYLQQALAVHREIGDQTTEAYALTNLGYLASWQGQYQQAAGYLRQALTLSLETGNRTAEARVLGGLGELDLRQGRYEPAAGYLGQALALCREAGDRSGQAMVLNSLGEVLLATGLPEQARTQHGAALTLASQINEERELGRAHDGLARAWQASGDATQARDHWREALTLYTRLGMPEAEQVRTQLVAG